MKKIILIVFSFFLVLGSTISCKPRIQTSPTAIIDYSEGDHYTSYEQSEDNRWSKACNDDFCIEFLFDETFDGFDKPIQYTVTFTAKKDLPTIKVHESWWWKEFLSVENITAPDNAILEPRTPNHEAMVWHMDCETNGVYIFVNSIKIPVKDALIKQFSNSVSYTLAAGVDWPISVGRSIQFDVNGKEINASQVETLRATHNWNKNYTPVYYTGTPLPRHTTLPTIPPAKNQTPTPYPIDSVATPRSPEDRLYP
ncbi:MAG: hypothetical protein GX853_03715 [Chloroflexi bacterium]|nr:hypothetical protein [Chloroflexota bacterium]